MTLTRRHWLAATAAAACLPHAQAQAASLKISHQFPSGTLTEGDFRDRLCRKFAAEVEKRSNGALKASVYPGSSLMKTNAQFSALRKGALDMSLVPLSYAGGEVPETNIGLMPALVPSYEQGAAWKTAEVGKRLAKVLDDKGVIIVSWIWQAGGVACRTRPLVTPEDAKGLKVRGGSREMDMMLKQAGASVISLPSNEIYAAMQTGAMEAAMTSSTSFMVCSKSFSVSPGKPTIKVERKVISGQMLRHVRMRSSTFSLLAGRFMAFKTFCEACWNGISKYGTTKPSAIKGITSSTLG